VNVAVPIALFGWPLVALFLFGTMSVRRATAWAFIAAWLFLPISGFKVSGIPEYDKSAAAGYSVLLGLLVFHPRLLLSLRPRLVDLPAFCLLVVPFGSSMSNGLGPYDGLSATFQSGVSWFLPYVCGRAVFRSVEDLFDVAHVIFLGGMAYVPFCLYEIRMSPQLNMMVYGFAQHSFLQTIRFGGYRPMVFMQHGLAVGLWMGMATVCGYWLWRTKRLARWGRFRLSGAVALLAVTFVLCKSTGAIALAALAIISLEAGRRMARPWVVLALVLAAPVFLAGRIAHVWDGRSLVDFTSQNVGAERAQSLDFRLDNEDELMAKALQRPLLGWGGWGRARIHNDEGKDLSVTDGLWIILLGNSGLIGLTSFVGVLTVGPALLLMSAVRGKAARSPVVEVLAVVLACFLIDCIPNAMPNPTFVALAGGMCSAALARRSPVAGVRRAVLLRGRAVAVADRRPTPAVRGPRFLG
jgi:O-antigen ligase